MKRNSIEYLFYHRINFDYSRYRYFFYVKGLIKLLKSSVAKRNSYQLSSSNSKLFIVTSINQWNIVKNISFKEDTEVYYLVSDVLKYCLKKHENTIYITDLIYGARLKFPDFKLIDIIKNICVLADMEKLFTYQSSLLQLRQLIENINANNVIVANDHSYIFRLLLLIEERSFKIHFFQHAQTNSNFPPLDYDFAYLWGSRDKNIYESMPTVAQIRIIGKPEFVSKRTPENGLVGIAYNEMDDHRRILSLISQLEHNKYSVLLRPHVNCKPIKGYASDRSNSYWNRISFQISGDSGIHIDALERGIQTYLFPWQNTVSEFIRELCLDSFQKGNLESSSINLLDSSFIAGYYKSFIFLDNDCTTYQLIKS